MKGTRHQLAPIMTGQKIVDRAVACWVPDLLFISCFQVVNIQELSGACRFGELLEKSPLLFQRHIFSDSPAARLGFQRVDPTIVVGHMRSIDCAQRYTRPAAIPSGYVVERQGRSRASAPFFRRSTWSLLHLTIRSPLRISQMV